MASARPANKVLTLMLVFNAQRRQVLLGMKKKGFGVGKWNGFGGKVELGESIAQGAHRELTEEAGIKYGYHASFLPPHFFSLLEDARPCLSP